MDSHVRGDDGELGDLHSDGERGSTASSAERQETNFKKTTALCRSAARRGAGSRPVPSQPRDCTGTFPKLSHVRPTLRWNHRGSRRPRPSPNVYNGPSFVAHSRTFGARSHS